VSRNGVLNSPNICTRT